MKPKYIDLGPASYAGMIFFSDDSGKIGCINSAGEEVIPPQFDYIYQSDPYDEYAYREMGSYFYDDGYAVVRLNGKLGVINWDGDFMIEPQFDAIYDTALF